MRPSLVHIMPISVTDILICYSNYKSLHIIDSLLGEHLFVNNTREFATNSFTVLPPLFILSFSGGHPPNRNVRRNRELSGLRGE